MPIPSFDVFVVALVACHTAASIWSLTKMRDVILPQDKKIEAFQMDHSRADFVVGLYDSALCLEGEGKIRALVIKKHPNTNARQSQVIRQRMQSVSMRQNEQLHVSLFQRDTM